MEKQFSVASILSQHWHSPNSLHITHINSHTSWLKCLNQDDKCEFKAEVCYDCHSRGFHLPASLLWQLSLSDNVWISAFHQSSSTLTFAPPEHHSEPSSFPPRSIGNEKLLSIPYLSSYFVSRDKEKRVGPTFCCLETSLVRTWTFHSCKEQCYQIPP